MTENQAKFVGKKAERTIRELDTGLHVLDASPSECMEAVEMFIVRLEELLDKYESNLEP